MGARVLLVAWKGSSATAWVETLTAGGYTVLLEDTTGERAWRTAKERGIDVVIIDGQKKPSHGRQTGHALRDTAKTRTIPIIWTNLDTEDTASVQTEVKPDVTLLAPTDALSALAALETLGETYTFENGALYDAAATDLAGGSIGSVETAVMADVLECLLVAALLPETPAVEPVAAPEPVASEPVAAPPPVQPAPKPLVTVAPVTRKPAKPATKAIRRPVSKKKAAVKKPAIKKPARKKKATTKKSAPKRTAARTAGAKPAPRPKAARTSGSKSKARKPARKLAARSGSRR